mmetsp:Transcript_54562/g.145708  ORF Transcript_54562/g.145708 Transcript_54562/m.145708 type:complete len:233 (+) Transcript_54562:224-922(+)
MLVELLVASSVSVVFPAVALATESVPSVLAVSVRSSSRLSSSPWSSSCSSSCSPSSSGSSSPWPPSSSSSSSGSPSCSSPVTTFCPVFVPTAPAPVSNVRVFLNPFNDGRTVGTNPCSVHFSAFSNAASALEKVSGFGYTNPSLAVSTPSLPFSQSWAECRLNGSGLAQPLIFAAMVFMRMVSLAPLPPQSFQAFLYPLVSSATWAAATAKRTAETRMVWCGDKKATVALFK